MKDLLSRYMYVRMHVFFILYYDYACYLLPLQWQWPVQELLLGESAAKLLQLFTDTKRHLS